MKRVCVYTSNRSEYSRLKAVMQKIKDRTQLELLVLVAGSHLLDRFGLTVKDIERDGFTINEKIYTVMEGENPITMAKIAAITMMELTSVLNNFSPDILVIVGDRYDLLPAVMAAFYLNILVAHIQGGEVSGSIDDTIRHAITKLSHIYFPATEKSRELIVKMGEDSSSLLNVGCPMIDY